MKLHSLTKLGAISLMFFSSVTLALNNISPVGNASGDPRAVAFDNTNAYFGHDHRSTEFCDNSQRLLLIEKMSLATSAKTTLLRRNNFCQAGAFALAPDGTHVYYVRGSGLNTSIRRVTIATPATDQLVSNEAATSLLVDGNNLYWTTATQIRMRAKTGGLVQTLFTNPAGSSFRLLGLDNTSLFFDQSVGSINNQSHQIRKIPIAGGSASTIRTVLTGRYITGFGQDSNNVYWTELSWGNTLGGSVRRVSKLGANFRTISTLPSTARAHEIAVTGNKVYWVEANGFDTRSPSVIRSRTNPTGLSGTFANETPNREGIAGIGPLHIKANNILFNQDRMYWYEYNWNGDRQVIKAFLNPPLVINSGS